MALNAPVLPDLKTVEKTVQGWAAAHPAFAAMLASGWTADRALAQWGVQLLNECRSAEAVAALRCAVALAPKEPVLWTNFGAALDQAGGFEEASACLEHSVALSRRQPDTWLLLGMVRKKSGDGAGAEAAYRVALEQEPDSPAAWQCLGLLKEEQKQFVVAIECFLACVKSGGNHPAIMANLGKLYYQTGGILEACDAFAEATRLEGTNAHYVQMLAKSRFLKAVIQGTSVDEALASYWISLAPLGGLSDDSRFDWLKTSFGLLSGFGHLEAATRVGRKRLELEPANVTTEYLMAAVAGHPGVDRSPPEFIAEHFDAFASGFEAQLVGVLGYDIPEKIYAAVRDITPAGHKYDILDAGCGTGLCGPLFRPLANSMTGVDLSAKMLEHAAKRGVYDELATEDLTSFLERSPAKFDLIVAADVMNYFGDLARVLAAARDALRPGGLLAFSTELLDGEGYRLQPMGRFAHARAYVRAVAGSGFIEEVCMETTIRLEANKRVPGELFLLRRRC